MQFNIPDSSFPRVVIVGGGFGGLTLARRLAKTKQFQVVLIDKNNYHQFQPLFYQVAMAGLEPSSISFPFRKAFQKDPQVFVRMAEVQGLRATEQEIDTDIGPLHYDHLVLAMGADTNWYGKEQVKAHAIPMKSVSEALFLRNAIFEDYERAVTAKDYDDRQRFLDIVVVGGGATGVEVAGSLAEMKRHIISKDYRDLNRDEIHIHLIDGAPKLLNAMSAEASDKAEEFLRDLGVVIWLNTVVRDYDGHTVVMNDGRSIQSEKVIWAAGIVGNTLTGIPTESLVRGNRLLCDEFNAVKGLQNVYALGDIAQQSHEAKWPNGHPQVAQPAMQQGQLLAKNLLRLAQNKPLKAFKYLDLGSMATIGRHRAVADLPYWKTQGFMAWVMWLFIHLLYILGTKNKIFVFLNWVWNYITYDQSLRLVIKPWRRESVK